MADAAFALSGVLRTRLTRADLAARKTCWYGVKVVNA